MAIKQELLDELLKVTWSRFFDTWSCPASVDSLSS
jgi:hypothetical protein